MSKATRNIGEATQESTTTEARRLISNGRNAGRPAAVGKLWHSARRCSWGIRFTDSLAEQTFEDGSIFEPVEIVPA